MGLAAIQRQYDEVIAANYDHDPQLVIGRALERALSQLRACCSLRAGEPPLKVLDIGLGTGLFFEQLRETSARRIEPFGLDISEKMVQVAQGRIPDLVAVVDDGARLDQHFIDQTFDVICTHFVTGFVPIEQIAASIWRKLIPGGYWSFVGGTSQGYPALQKKAESRLLRRMFGGAGKFQPADLITPADCQAVVDCFARHAFLNCQAETFEPELLFNDFDEFMEFAYHGGWLTPFVEELGLHRASKTLRRVLNSLVFPIRDYHRIAIALGKKCPPS
jgi:SAM-dependent methyltransferase